MRYTFIFICTTLLFVYACSSSDGKKDTENCQKPTAVTNPNGMSEMSQIMEDWYAAMKTAGDSIRAGKMATNIPEFDKQKALNAQTSKTNMKKENFDSFTETFFFNYTNFRKATDGYQQAMEYNLTVKACVNCHEQYCHGPLVRIKKLAIADI
ncbi:MAG TPA: hypothetical protein VD905_19930 [Flavobacteriales bacterium]|nr:hypothetical protein [Flavobacteriales bacterium]